MELKHPYDARNPLQLYCRLNAFPHLQAFVSGHIEGISELILNYALRFVFPEEVEEEFAYPLSCIGDPSYELSSIFRPDIHNNLSVEHADHFPSSITGYLYYQIGHCDEESWILLGLLDNGLFFQFEASCDYTGFDCQGGMSLYLGRTLLEILDHFPYNINEFLVFQNRHEKKIVSVPVKQIPPPIPPKLHKRQRRRRIKKKGMHQAPSFTVLDTDV